MAHEWAEQWEDSWSDREIEFFEDMAGDTELLQDDMLQAIYHTAYFDTDIDTDDRLAARDAFSDYLMDRYGLDFEDWWDWDEWKEIMGYDE